MSVVQSRRVGQVRGAVHVGLCPAQADRDVVGQDDRAIEFRAAAQRHHGQRNQTVDLPRHDTPAGAR